MMYELVGPRGARLLIRVEDNVVVEAKSQTHDCFIANFLGDPWSDVRKAFEGDGFTVHSGH